MVQQCKKCIVPRTYNILPLVRTEAEDDAKDNF